MSTPILETIAVNILTTLQGVTTGHGYNYTITAFRHHQYGDKPQHLGVIIHQLEPREEPVDTFSKQEWMQPFQLECFVIQSETDTTATETYLNILWGDLTKALLVDRTRGGYSIDTFVRKPEYFRDMTGGIDCMAILVEIHYRTEKDNPFSL